MKNKTVLITGGCGFIGHHIVEHILRKTSWNIIVLDKLTYASMGLDKETQKHSLDLFIKEVMPAFQE